MIRGFFEYPIRADKREEYLDAIRTLREKNIAAGLIGYGVSESLERENLFVETFLAPSMEEYRGIEAKLLEDPDVRACLERVEACLHGGPAKKHVWFFAELPFS